MNRQFGRILIFVVVAAIAIAMVAFYAAVKSTMPPDTGPAPSLEIPSVALKNEIKVPKFNVYVKHGTNGKDVLMVEWQNLPFDTKWIKIFRSKDKNSWEIWQTVPAPQFATSGSSEIPVAAADNVNGYYYQAEAVSTLGETVWQSTSTPVSNAPLPPIVSPAETGSSTPASGTTSPASAPATPPSSDASDTPTPPPAAPAPTTTPPGTSSTSEQPSSPAQKLIYYYSPTGQIIGTSTVNDASFWVQFADNAIELGWQNLPSDANGFTIYRATDPKGPWLQLLRQTKINPSVPNSVKITDSSHTSNQYYELSAQKDDYLIGTFGPILLPAQK